MERSVLPWPATPPASSSARRGRRGGAAVLLVVFLLGVGSARARALQIDCGCLGDGGEVAAGESAHPTESPATSPSCAVAPALARRPRSRLALGGRRPPPAHRPRSPTVPAEIG